MFITLSREEVNEMIKIYLEKAGVDPKRIDDPAYYVKRTLVNFDECVIEIDD
jgi:hypothetical protein